MHLFEAQLKLRSTPEAVFDFLTRPDNVELIAHPDAGVEFTVAPDVMELGTRLEFKIEGFGVTQKVVHEIITFERPRLFVEKQVQGPLGHWVHEHAIAADGDGHVLIVDRIQFKPPGGLIGFIATEGRIRKSLEQGFAHTYQEIRRHLEGAA